MPDLHFILPGNRARRTGGFIYDDRIIRGLGHLGHTVEAHALPDDFPLPSDRTRERAAETLAAIPDGARTVVDGLAFGVLPDLAKAQRQRIELIALVHHPLAHETGLASEDRERLFESERAALAHAHRVVTTSRTTARALDAYGLDPDQIHVVRPGTDPAPLAQRTQDGSLRLFCAGTVTPRKGHDVLLRALAELREHAWTLVCAGSLEADPDTASRTMALSRSLDLTDRVTFLGEIDGDRMQALYGQADVFVLASHYEGYGMVLNEAQAHGLPVVSTTGGAIPEAVGEEAALLVPPGDHRALAEALRRVLGDEALRTRLTAAAERARAGLPTWNDAARAFAEAVALPVRP